MVVNGDETQNSGEFEMKIVEWLQDGNDELSKSVTDTDQLIETAGRALDDVCSWDIMGPILFKGDDGEYYVGTMEFNIAKAHPDYVKQVIEENTK